ncbi:unnamed protein product, partial [Ectocarpus sp. 6 AP-2014]
CATGRGPKQRQHNRRRRHKSALPPPEILGRRAVPGPELAGYWQHRVHLPLHHHHHLAPPATGRCNTPTGSETGACVARRTAAAGRGSFARGHPRRCTTPKPTA